MKDVTLVFTNNLLMAECILQQRLSRVQTNSKYHTLTGVLSSEEIQKACKSFDADILKPVGAVHYE